MLHPKNCPDLVQEGSPTQSPNTKSFVKPRLANDAPKLFDNISNTLFCSARFEILISHWLTRTHRRSPSSHACFGFQPAPSLAFPTAGIMELTFHIGLVATCSQPADPIPVFSMAIYTAGVPQFTFRVGITIHRCRIRQPVPSIARGTDDIPERNFPTIAASNLNNLVGRPRSGIFVKEGFSSTPTVP